jgi:hypothetical protein
MEEKIVQPVVNTKIVQPVHQTTPQPTDVQEVHDAVEPSTPVEAVESKPTAESVIKSNIPYQIDPLFHEVASYFNIEQKDWDSAKTKLGAIVDYVAQTANSGDAGDILLKLRDIEENIQKPQWGEKRYTNVYKYVRLAQQRSSIDKAMSALQRGF